MNTPKKFRVWLPSLNKFGDDNSVFMNCYGKLYGVTRPSLVDDSRSIVNIGQFKEFDGYTIQWYTGLTDKNGKEIYEGDIVIDTQSQKYAVFANEKYGKYDIRVCGTYKQTSTSFFTQMCDKKYIEVIGNIFEHKHLLEK